MAQDPAATLRTGLEVLAPVLVPHGFVGTEITDGRGSGGFSAEASFLRSDRELHLSLRVPSLLVRYVIAGQELTHPDYMRALLGPAGGNAFPSFSTDPLESFNALRLDLELRATDFVSGPGSDFARCWEAARAASRRTGFQRISDATRDLEGRQTDDRKP